MTTQPVTDAAPGEARPPTADPQPAMPPVDPHERARGVAVSAASQLGAKAVHFLVNVISSLAIIRYLAPADYGDYAIVLTTTLLVGLLADFGLPKLAVRDITRDHAPEAQVLGSMVAARLGLAVLAVAISQLVLLAVGASPTAHLAGAVASAIFFADAVLGVIVVFQVRLQQQYEAGIRLGMELFETAVLFGLIAMGAPLPALFLAPVLATALGAGAAVVLARRRYATTFGYDRSRLVHLMRESLPVGPALLIAVIYLKLDILLLGLLTTPTEVGLYSAAYQPIEYAFLATALIINVIFPLLADSYGRGDLERFAQMYRRGAEILVAVVAIVPLALLFTARPLLETVYSDPYGAAATPMIILALALVLMTVNAYQAFVLLVGGRQRATLKYNGAALVVASLLGFALIPFWGMSGAALAALGTAVFVLIASTASVRRGLGARLTLSPLTRIAGAAAIVAGALLALSLASVPWPVILLSALPLYVVALILTGFLRRSDLRRLTALLSPSKSRTSGVGA